jgi:hypothetical protein
MPVALFGRQYSGCARLPAPTASLRCGQLVRRALGGRLGHSALVFDAQQFLRTDSGCAGGPGEFNETVNKQGRRSLRVQRQFVPVTRSNPKPISLETASSSRRFYAEA